MMASMDSREEISRKNLTASTGIVNPCTDVELSAYPAYFLIWRGFNQAAVAQSVGQLQQKGSSATLLGLSLDAVKSQEGILVVPTATIYDITNAGMITLLVPPGNASFLATLKTEPRIHQFVASVCQQGGIVGVAETISPHFADLSTVAEVTNPSTLCTVVDFPDWVRCQLKTAGS